MTLSRDFFRVESLHPDSGLSRSLPGHRYFAPPGFFCTSSLNFYARSQVLAPLRLCRFRHSQPRPHGQNPI
jgi:hypothetical protein